MTPGGPAASDPVPRGIGSRRLGLLMKTAQQIYEKQIGKQVNMASESWDGKRIYFTSSLLANWDKKGADNEQFFKAYEYNGKELLAKFSIDFLAEKLGRPHQMRFGAYALYSQGDAKVDGLMAELR